MTKRHNPTFLSRQQLCLAICRQAHISRRNPSQDDFSKRELSSILNYLTVLNERVTTEITSVYCPPASRRRSVKR